MTETKARRVKAPAETRDLARRVRARAPSYLPRSVARAEGTSEKDHRVDRGARLGKRTRRLAKARALTRRLLEERLASLTFGAAVRRADAFRKAGTMPHKASGKHQEKLENRREARRSARSVALA